MIYGKSDFKQLKMHIETIIDSDRYHFLPIPILPKNFSPIFGRHSIGQLPTFYWSLISIFQNLLTFNDWYINSAISALY